MGCVCLRKAQSAGYGVIGDAINLDILGGKKKKKKRWCVKTGAKKQLVDVSGPLHVDLKVFCTIIWTGATALEQMKVIKKILLM